MWAAQEGRADLEHPLADADRVLAGTAGDVVDRVALDHLVVHGQVLLLGEDLVVQLDLQAKRGSGDSSLA